MSINNIRNLFEQAIKETNPQDQLMIMEEAADLSKSELNKNINRNNCEIILNIRRTYSEKIALSMARFAGSDMLGDIVVRYASYFHNDMPLETNDIIINNKLAGELIKEITIISKNLTTTIMQHFSVPADEISVSLPANWPYQRKFKTKIEDFD